MEHRRTLSEVEGRIAVVGGSLRSAPLHLLAADGARPGAVALLDRLRRLAEIGAALSSCADAEEIEAAAERALALVPAVFARLVARTESGAAVELGAWPATARGVHALGSPGDTALASGEPLWLESREIMAARSIASADVAVRLGAHACGAVPIRSGSAPVALELGFGSAQLLDASGRRYLAIAAQLFGGALLRARFTRERQLTVRLGPNVVEMSSMLDAFSVGVALISADGVILAINRAAVDLFDIGEGERPRLAPELLERLAPAWPNGRAVTLDETPFRRALRGELVRDELLSLVQGGRARRWVLAGAAPLGAPGAVHSVVLNVADVTRCRELEHQRAALLRHVVGELEPGLRALERAALKFHAGGTPAKPPQCARETVRAARRLSTSLHEAKTALSFDTGSIRTHPELIDVRAFLLDLLERNFAGVDVGRVIPILPPGLPRGLVDPDHLEQMIVELLRGAFAASSNGTRVVLAADAVGGVRVTVASPGRDATPTELARVFDRFFRGPGRLHLVRSLAEANGGRVMAESGAGRGLVIHLVLRVTPR